MLYYTGEKIGMSEYYIKEVLGDGGGLQQCAVPKWGMAQVETKIAAVHCLHASLIMRGMVGFTCVLTSVSNEWNLQIPYLPNNHPTDNPETP